MSQVSATLAGMTTTAEVLTLREIALFFRISERTAYDLVTTGRLPAFKVGGQWRASRAELERFIDSRSE
jgi:excisionase family DNA binding protein